MARSLPWQFGYEVEKQPEDHPLGRTLLRPLVEARIVAQSESNRYMALIDSGSDYCLAAPIVGMEAGVDIHSGRETTVRVGGARRPISVVETTLLLCDPRLRDVDGGCTVDNALSWTAEVGFFTRWDDPPFSIILGQVGFFDQFAVMMSRHTQTIVLEPVQFLDRYGVVAQQPPSDPSRHW